MLTLQPLPYGQNALEPHISEKTISYHYGKHHKSYIDNLNNLLAGTDYSLELPTNTALMEIIKDTAKQKNDPKAKKIFNNAAQAFNHDFYWHSMTPDPSKTKPSKDMLSLISDSFGSYSEFYTVFKNAGISQFGSGWTWLIAQGKTLKVVHTGNAEIPLGDNFENKLLLTMDVWEHAYYIDFFNRRPDYISIFLEHLINWEFAEKNYLL